MANNLYTVISGTGSYIPPKRVKNEDFISNEFYDSNGQKLAKTNEEIIQQFLNISTIAERRYVEDDLLTSDIAFFAAEEAIKSANIDKEELDYIILAHNFGDIQHHSNRSDFVPSIAARVKYKLEIQNPETIAYDIAFGCPGWVQGLIQADYFIKSGDAKKILVVGADVLSRISDPHDRDSMLYADGAGAVVLESKHSETPIGILAHKCRSDTFTEANMLFMDKSYHCDQSNKDNIYLKMHGRKVYQYALENVPKAIKACIEKSKVQIDQIKKILIHQANGKMDDAIIQRLYKLFDIVKFPKNILPMTISWLGNSSVATVPTLLDLILKNKLSPHQIEENDILVFASVGAGMNINSVIYKM